METYAEEMVRIHGKENVVKHMLTGVVENSRWPAEECSCRILAEDILDVISVIEEQERNKP